MLNTAFQTWKRYQFVLFSHKHYTVFISFYPTKYPVCALENHCHFLTSCNSNGHFACCEIMQSNSRTNLFALWNILLVVLDVNCNKIFKTIIYSIIPHKKPRPNQLTPKGWRYTVANFKLFWFNLYSVLLEIIWKKPHIVFFIHNKHFSQAIFFYLMPLIKCLFGMFWLFHYVGDFNLKFSSLKFVFFLPLFKKRFAAGLACSNAILYSF